eukprot:10861779-Prorocentrum_lima.AAC.1
MQASPQPWPPWTRGRMPALAGSGAASRLRQWRAVLRQFCETGVPNGYTWSPVAVPLFWVMVTPDMRDT